MNLAALPSYQVVLLTNGSELLGLLAIAYSLYGECRVPDRRPPEEKRGMVTTHNHYVDRRTVLIMYVPEGSDVAEVESRRPTVPARQHYVCGSVALVVTCVLAVLTYSALVRVAMVFGLLATTVLVFALAIFWFLLWEFFVVAWEWRAGRFSVTLRS